MASAAAAITGITGTVLGFVTTSTILAPLGSGSAAYRPEVWGSGSPLVMITVPGSQAQTVGSSTTQDDVTGTVHAVTQSTAGTAPVSYVFDGYPRVEHNLNATATRIPTQTGAAITDHVYLEPRRIIVEIVMSEALDSYISGQFQGGSSKSISAFQVLKGIYTARQAVSVSTRLDTYQNMILVDLHAPDDNTTYNGLRATATFQELIFAQVSTQAATQRPDATAQQTMGQTSVSTSSSTIESQHNVTLPGSGVSPSTIAGAGDYSSNAIGS